jgi:GGDEF domain-containing protein
MARLLSLEKFEAVVEGEISVCSDYDLPLVMVVVFLRRGWGEEDLHTALSELRLADVACRTGRVELAVALPNSGEEDAEVVAERLHSVLPEVEVKTANLQGEESAADLVDRARGG